MKFHALDPWLVAFHACWRHRQRVYLILLFLCVGNHLLVMVHFVTELCEASCLFTRATLC